MPTQDHQALIEALESIRDSLVEPDPACASLLERVHPGQFAGAVNLFHYLALRRHDLRPLQRELAGRGLSSLGRAELNVLGSIDAVIDVLHRLSGHPSPSATATAIDFAAAERRLSAQADALLGVPAAGRAVRIMVTLPAQAATDPGLVEDLLRQGMDCARINCAHDDARTWSAMIANLRAAAAAVGRPCRVVMDLAGPKLRTGALQSGPAVVRVRPHRDACGRVVAPARVRLVGASSPHGHEGGRKDAAPAAQPQAPAEACLPVPADWLARLAVGDRLAFVDARAARRTLQVVESGTQGCVATLCKTAYVMTGTVLRRIARGDRPAADDVAAVGALPHAEGSILLHTGDLLRLERGPAPAGGLADAGGNLAQAARIGCTIGSVIDRLCTGHAVWFDDGRIGGRVEAVDHDGASIRITHARLSGARLRADKGINLPDTDLGIPAMTPKDVADLEFAAVHADAIGMSFVNSACDVELLQHHLHRLGGNNPGVILKIETRRGFESLPQMLLAAMRMPSCAVMIARGDLAVECGFERLAELQEEILRVCESAQVPVVWATQVLDNLARDGLPSRAEISDAAMGQRADCVMLNKGPHITDAVRVLDDILRRMQAHQNRNRAMLRELRLAHALSGGPDSARPGTRPVSAPAGAPRSGRSRPMR